MDSVTTTFCLRMVESAVFGATVAHGSSELIASVVCMAMRTSFELYTSLRVTDQPTESRASRRRRRKRSGLREALSDDTCDRATMPLPPLPEPPKPIHAQSDGLHHASFCDDASKLAFHEKLSVFESKFIKTRCNDRSAQENLLDATLESLKNDPLSDQGRKCTDDAYPEVADDASIAPEPEPMPQVDLPPVGSSEDEKK